MTLATYFNLLKGTGFMTLFGYIVFHDISQQNPQKEQKNLKGILMTVELYLQESWKGC